MARRNNKKNDKLGPSVPSKVTSDQQEWHAVSSDDEEAYVTEMKELYKD